MLRGYLAGYMSRSFPRLWWKTILLYRLLQYEHAVFYGSNNKSNSVAKIIDNIFHVVKDRIQDQPIGVEHTSVCEYFYGSVYQRLTTQLNNYVASMGCWKAF